MTQAVPCLECGAPFRPKTNAKTCSATCAKQRKNKQGNDRRRERYAVDPQYNEKLRAKSAEYKRVKTATDPAFKEKERQRSALNKRVARSDPVVRARDNALCIEYQRKRRAEDREFCERDNARRRRDYIATRNDSARKLLELLNRGELAGMGEPCFVYLFYDSNDALLYVGIANDPKRRLYQHARDKSWFEDIAVTKLAAFSSETEALSAEAYLIRALSPLHNVQHNLREDETVDTAHAPILLTRFASVDLGQPNSPRSQTDFAMVAARLAAIQARINARLAA